jgi:palmitoyltransferase ZDHHC9/14/18
MGIYLLGASAGHVWAWRKQNNTTSAHAINSNRVPFAMFVFGLLAFMYPASLWGYHTFLILRGQSTREYLNSNKFAKQDRHRPFNQKPWWKNFVVVLARPRPPTFLNFKDKYVDGDQRFGERRGHRITPLSEGQKGGVEMQKMNGHANGNGTRTGFQGPSAIRSERENAASI